VPNIDDNGIIKGCFLMINKMMTHDGIFKISEDPKLVENKFWQFISTYVNL
jgi:hypothetical protein